MLESFKIKVLLKKADSLFNQEKYDDSLIYYEKILSLNNNHIKSLYRKAYIFYINKKYDDALIILFNILEETKCGDALLLIGRIYFFKDSIDKSLFYYNVFLDEEIIDSSKYFEEIKYFSDLKLKYISDSYEYFFQYSINLIDLYLQRYDFIDSDVTLIEALSRKSHILFYLNKFEESLDNANQVIKLIPESSLGYFLKSINFLKLKNYEDSLIYIDYALDLDDDETILNQTKAEILYYLKDFEGSLNYLNLVCSKKDITDSYFFISKINIINNNFNNALKNINKAIKIEKKSYSDLKNNYSLVYYDHDYFNLFWHKSLILSKLNQFDEASKIIDCLLEKEESAKNYCLKSMILFEMDDYENALMFVNKALGLKPDCKQAIELKEKIETL